MHAYIMWSGKGGLEYFSAATLYTQFSLPTDLDKGSIWG